MATCTACGSDVTSKKFCNNCGAPVPVASTPAEPAMNNFCTSCGRKSSPGQRFCSDCGAPLEAAAALGTSMSGARAQPSEQYANQPQPYPNQYALPQYPRQQYAPPQYPQQEPMLGQQPMVLRCPTCMAMSPLGTASCPSCRTSLAGIVPTPSNMPQQGGMLGGLGGMMQGGRGNMAMGALGGAAAVIGGEMLLGGIERRIEGNRDYGYGEEYHHHREEGMLGELGELGKDVGLF
jgi:hypothetical protein